MRIFLTAYAVLVFAAAAYRVGFRLWAENPPVVVPLSGADELTAYQVAALKAWRLGPDRLARTVLGGMVLGGVLRPDGTAHESLADAALYSVPVPGLFLGCGSRGEAAAPADAPNPNPKPNSNPNPGEGPGRGGP